MRDAIMKYMKNPKHKPLLITGIALYVFSPFSAYFFTPILSPLTCPPPEPGFQLFKCVQSDIWTGAAVIALFLILGTTCILYSLKLKRN
jgi:hypothetical protein